MKIFSEFKSRKELFQWYMKCLVNRIIQIVWINVYASSTAYLNMDTKKTVTGKMEAKMANGIPNGDSRSPKFPEDAKYDDIYWYIFFIY